MGWVYFLVYIIFWIDPVKELINKFLHKIHNLHITRPNNKYNHKQRERHHKKYPHTPISININ